MLVDNENDVDDMDADIRAAYSEASGVVPPEPTDIKVKDATETIVEPEKAEKAVNRDETGKFVAKQAEPAQDNTEQPKTVETPQESIRPPASWSAQAKADFAALPPHIQKEVSKREGDIDKGFRERAEQLKRYEPLEAAIAPHRQKWAVAGVDEATAVKQLLAASDWLDRDPVTALQHLARQYSVNIASLGQPSQAQPDGGAGQPQAQPDPVAKRLEALERQIAERDEQALGSQIEAFSANPANLYFENVKPAMAKLLSAGLATDLQDAYDQAVWANPTIRGILQSQNAPKPAVDPARTAKAKAASGSVTGSPGNGPLPTSNGSIEDDVRLAFAQAGGRA